MSYDLLIDAWAADEGTALVSRAWVTQSSSSSSSLFLCSWASNHANSRTCHQKTSFIEIHTETAGVQQTCDWLTSGPITSLISAPPIGSYCGFCCQSMQQDRNNLVSSLSNQRLSLSLLVPPLLMSVTWFLVTPVFFWGVFLWCFRSVGIHVSFQF